MATKPDSFLTHDQVIYCIRKIYPELIHGRDFWVAQEVEANTNKQLAEARIMMWTAKLTQPSQADITAQWKSNKAEYLAQEMAQEARAQREVLLNEADTLVYKAMDSNDDALRMALSVYRQQLRDVPQQAGFPQDICWPVIPDASSL